MRATFAAAVASLFLSLPALSATPFSIDASDMWWNSDESGWGVNIVQQNNVIFATLYVYGADGSARWFVAPDMEAAQVPSDRPYIFSGTLYETTGPVFSTSFNPASVTRRAVGTAAFEYAPPRSAFLTYSVDGRVVTKQVTRQSWRVPDMSGDYYVWRSLRSSCSSGGPAGDTYQFHFAQSGNALTVQARQGTALICTYSGTLSQEGRMGALSGTASCTSGDNAPFSFTGIEVGVNGFTARFNGTERGCRVYGNVAGARADVPEAAG